MTSVSQTLNLRKEILDKYLILPNSSDFINNFIDFIGFYYDGNTWETSKIKKTGLSDNDNTSNYNNFFLDYNNNRFCMVYTLHLSLIVPVARFETVFIKWSLYTKVSLYWKWLKVMRDVPILYSDFVWLLIKLGYKYQWLNYTRLDVTADYSKLAYNIQCTLRTAKTNLIYWEKWLETKYFWSKKSSVLIRYYNKKIELEQKNWVDLYPEYDQFTEVMRYEIQLKNKALPLKLHYNYSTLIWLKQLVMGEDTAKLHIKPVSRKSKKSMERAKSLLHSFLHSLSSRYDLSYDINDINFIYTSRLNEQKK